MREGATYECKNDPSPGLGSFLHSYEILLIYYRRFQGDLRFIIYTQDGPMYKQQLPMSNSIWPKIGLGSFLYSYTQFIELLGNCFYKAMTENVNRPIIWTTDQSRYQTLHGMIETV